MCTPASYDLIDEKWSQARSMPGFREKRYVDRFLELIAPGAHVLDLGLGCFSLCGSTRLVPQYIACPSSHESNVAWRRAQTRIVPPPLFCGIVSYLT